MKKHEEWHVEFRKYIYSKIYQDYCVPHAKKMRGTFWYFTILIDRRDIMIKDYKHIEYYLRYGAMPTYQNIRVKE